MSLGTGHNNLLDTKQEEEAVTNELTAAEMSSEGLSDSGTGATGARTPAVSLDTLTISLASLS